MLIETTDLKHLQIRKKVWLSRSFQRYKRKIKFFLDPEIVQEIEKNFEKEMKELKYLSYKINFDKSVSLTRLSRFLYI